MDDASKDGGSVVVEWVLGSEEAIDIGTAWR
jgi:hypothetical protein